MVITGRLLSYVSGTRLATVEGIPQQVPVLRHVTSIAAGDTALVVRSDHGQAWVIGIVGASAGPLPPEVPDDVTLPSPAPIPQRVIPLRPTQSGTWRDGAWRDGNLAQGAMGGVLPVSVGGAWWGPLPQEIVSAVLYLQRSDNGGSTLTPNLRLLAGTSRPVGAPTVVLSTPGPLVPPDSLIEWPLPAAWVTRLNAGTAGGIGVGGSELTFLELSASGLGMTLSVTVD